ncbi:MAG: relaxase domain-containing protein, partial [Alphaproteobacteria bacterium]|nr:relaxase domain-containing protein [Alphaproteobacteria bacterium]
MVAGLTDLTSTTMTVEYFSREGYYAKNDPRQRRASFWHGGAARALGMAKHVSPRAFERILSGYVPGTDIRLGRVRDGEHQHRPGFDLTLSAPKTVSLEALLYGDRRVLGAHDAAVKATLDWLERELLQTRSWDPATRQRPRVAAHGLVAAGFRHLTSRDQDPQIHTHCIVANMTRNRAGEWRSVEPTELRRNVRLIGAVYRQELAQRLLGLGFRIEATMIGGVPGFEIAGYGRAFVDAFSSRRREILAWLDAHGLPWSAALTQQAALITRKK